MAETKKVFFGSLFDFTESGKDSLIRNIRDAFDNDESVPFISYDANNKVFACELEREDTTITSTLVASVKGFIDHAPHRQLGIEEEPEIVPFEGIRVEDAYDDEIEDANQLVELGDESGDEQGHRDTLQALHNVTAYWQPSNGDISILTTDIAHEIAASESCQLWPEAAEKRVRIVNGHFDEALRKLQNLEPLLVLLARQRAGDAIKTNGNVLILPANVNNPSIEYLLLKFHELGFNRVMTQQVTDGVLEQKLIAEMRLWENGETITPINFTSDAISRTHTISSSSVWHNAPPFTFGDQKNMVPHPVPLAVADNGVKKETSSSLVIPAATKFMGPEGVSKVTEWNANVDEQADPELVPEEPPAEPAQPQRRRRVYVSSDSEEEEEEQPTTVSPTRLHRPAETLSSERQDAHEFLSMTRTDLPSSVNTPANNLENVDQYTPATPKIEHQQDRQRSSPAQSPTRLQPPSRPVHEHSSSSATMNDQIPDFWSTADANDQGRLAQNNDSLSALGSSLAGGSRWTNDDYKSPSTTMQPLVDVSNQSRLSESVRGDLTAVGSRRVHGTEQGDDSSHYPFFDPETTAINLPLRPPPGFENSFTNGSHQAQSVRSSQSALISAVQPTYARIDSSRDRLADPMVHANAQHANSDLMSLTSRNSRTSGATARSRGHPPPPRKNYGLLAQRQIAQLQQNATAPGQSPARGSHTRQGGERIQKDDEVSTRQYHNTMNQQAPNPGKRGGGKKVETRKEKAERIAKARQDAHPTPKVPPAKPNVTVSEPDVNQMSNTLKKKLRQNGKLAEVAPKTAEQEALLRQTDALIQDLKPLFGASRAFAGFLRFEIQLGQVLAGPHPSLKHENTFLAGRWHELFGSTENSTKVPTIFTNMLTANGADMDRALDIDIKLGNTNLWDKRPSGPPKVLFEFHCQSKSNEEFWIVVDQTGKHLLRKALATVGNVNLHMPASVWDACAVLNGHVMWHNPSPAIVENAKSFVESLYVNGTKHRVEAYFRPPVNSEITIRNLVMKRVSLHNYLENERQDFQLCITEVKTLDTAVHPRDKGLYRAAEKIKYEDMVREGRVHYEMSVVHSGINDVLARNEKCNLGELTAEMTTGQRLLERERLKAMLDLSIHMASRIDWMGARNIGTLPRLLDAADRRFAALSGSVVGSQLRPSRLNGTQLRSSRVNASQRMPRGSTMISGNLAAPGIVHGVRMDTIAEERVDEAGQRYKIGLGNARVPLVDDEPIGPDDSASQFGGPRSPAPGPRRPGDKGAGFW